MENTVQTRFNQSSRTYDQACSIQQATNTELLAALLHYKNVNEPLGAIADLGCGTGNSTRLLLESFKCQPCYAIDIAEQLLKIAQRKLKNHSVEFIQTSFNNSLPLAPLNLAYANMSLHWASSLEKTLNIVFNSLKNKGILSFSVPVLGTFKEIKHQHKNTFPSLSAIESIVNNTQFSLISQHQKTFIAKFPSPQQALKSIKNVGANILFQQKKKGLRGKNFYINVFKKRHAFDLTYQVGFFILKK